MNPPSSSRPTRNSKDYLLPFLIIISIGVIAALSMRLWGLWGEDEGSALTLSGKAELSEIFGEVEIYLPAAEAWKITQTATVLNAGESVRTASDGNAILIFDDGSAVNLGNSSELKIKNLRNSLSKKEVRLALVRGIAGVTIGGADADFEIASKFLKISHPDGQFILNSAEAENVATAIAGGFTAAILDPQNPKNPELKNFIV